MDRQSSLWPRCLLCLATLIQPKVCGNCVHVPVLTDRCPPGWDEMEWLPVGHYAGPCITFHLQKGHGITWLRGSHTQYETIAPGHEYTLLDNLQQQNSRISGTERMSAQMSADVWAGDCGFFSLQVSSGWGIQSKNTPLGITMGCILWILYTVSLFSLLWRHEYACTVPKSCFQSVSLPEICSFHSLSICGYICNHTMPDMIAIIQNATFVPIRQLCLPDLFILSALPASRKASWPPPPTGGLCPFIRVAKCSHPEGSQAAPRSRGEGEERGGGGAERHHWAHLWEETGAPCVQGLPTKVDLGSHICTASQKAKQTNVVWAARLPSQKQRPRAEGLPIF